MIIRKIGTAIIILAVCGCKNGLYQIETLVEPKAKPMAYRVVGSTTAFEYPLHVGGAMPIVVTDTKKADSHDVSLTLCTLTLGLIPGFESYESSHEVVIETPMGKKTADYTARGKTWLGWIPCFIPYPGMAEARVYGTSATAEGLPRYEREAKQRVVDALVGQYSRDEYEKFVLKKNAEVENERREKEIKAREDAERARIAAEKKEAEQVLAECTLFRKDREKAKAEMQRLEDEINDVVEENKRYKYVVTNAVAQFRRITGFAENGIPEAQGVLSALYWNISNDVQMARSWSDKAVAQGDGRGMNVRGSLYAEGKGGYPKSDKDASCWYRKGAEAGCCRAQRNFALRLLNGKGVEKDHKEAAKWAEKAAVQGDAWAQRILGLMYQEGWGVQKSTTDAFKWIDKAAAQHDVVAQETLAEFYEKGVGVVKDKEKALYLYHVAASNGNIQCMCHLGDYYLKKDNYLRDEEIAVQWYEKAAEAGSSYGKFSLAWEFRRKGWRKLDDSLMKRCLELFKEIAEGDSPLKGRGCFELGKMYGRGWCVKEDVMKALEWYEKSAEMGEVDAIRELESLERSNFDEATQMERKKKRLAKGIGSVEDLLKEAKKHIDETFVFKGFYLGMTLEAANRLLLHYDGKRKYEKTKEGLKDSHDNSASVFDNPGQIVVKAENGIVSEFIFSRRLIDLIFESEGRSPETFVAELKKSSSLLDKIETKRVMVPNWHMRDTQGELAMQMQGQVMSQDLIGAAIETSIKLSKAQKMIADMKSPGTCYYKVSDKGFVLEITPNDGTPEKQVLFFVLKKRK